jgi:hypothetical protein
MRLKVGMIGDWFEQAQDMFAGICVEAAVEHGIGRARCRKPW